MFVFVNDFSVMQTAVRAQDLFGLLAYFPNGYIVESDLGFAYRPVAPVEEQPAVDGAQTL